MPHSGAHTSMTCLEMLTNTFLSANIAHGLLHDLYILPRFMNTKHGTLYSPYFRMVQVVSSENTKYGYLKTLDTMKSLTLIQLLVILITIDPAHNL